MIIRDLEPTDIPAARMLLEQLGYSLDEAEVRRRLDKVLAAAGHRVIVAVMRDRVVGLLHVFERPALEKPCEAVVQALVVESTKRSSGIGETLMREAEAWATARGLTSVSLYSRIDRARAHAFYERIGYRLKGTSHLMGRG
jgi:predicted N-acetyltransferase YhbS